VPIQIWPLLPLLEDPELKIKAPDTPVAPAFALRNVTVPLVVTVPSPEPRLSAPPASAVLRPDITRTSPPTPLVPLPTVMVTAPPRPAVAAPEPTQIWPLLPLLVDPELNTRAPLVPLVPAFMLRIVTMPLEYTEPSPLDKLRAPPVVTVLSPAKP
jgi:hypothetical protein